MRYIVQDGFCPWFHGGCTACSKGRDEFQCGEDVFPSNHARSTIEILQLPFFLANLVFWLIREAGTEIFMFNAVSFSLQVAVGRRSLTAEFRVWYWVSPWLLLSTKWNLEKFYLRMLRFAPVSFIPPLPHIHLHLNTALIRRKPGSLEHINTSTFRFFSFCRVKLKRNRRLNLMSPNANVSLGNVVVKALRY
jgi:hypothetical protein